jgi:multiple sugar transport system substrate-binding protein
MLRTIGMNRRRFVQAGGALTGLAFLPWGVRRAAAQDDPEAGTVESEPIEGKTNVTWWSHTGEAFIEANKEMIARFEEANPDVHIVYQHFPYDVYYAKLPAAYASQEASDVQQMFGTWVADYAVNGLLDPVPEDLAAGMADTFLPATIGGYTLDGVAYGMPNEFNIENGGMLVNDALFEEAGITDLPATWLDLVAAAKQLVQFDADGKLTQVGFGFKDSDPVNFLLYSMILQQGASYWADDGIHVDFSTDAAKKAFADMTALVTTDQVDSVDAYAGEAYEFFLQGKAGMAMRGPWVIPEAAAFPDLTFEYAPIPPYAGTEPKFAAESGWGEVVNARSAPEIKQAAWRFIAFMHETDNIRDWNITTFTLPSRADLVNDPQILEAAPELATSFAALPYGQWIGPVRNRDAFFQFVHDAFTSVALGQQDANSALAACEQNINTMIDQTIGP